jgi:hypothetical protein
VNGDPGDLVMSHVNSGPLASAHVGEYFHIHAEGLALPARLVLGPRTDS